MINNFPTYRQRDEMECGPSCLKIISKHYGKIYTINTIKKHANISREGVSLFTISEAAEKLGYKTMGARLNMEQLEKEAVLPCIAFWNMKHFLVVYKVTKDKVYVSDPANGLATFKRDEFEKGWAMMKQNADSPNQGVALLLEPSPDFYEPLDEDDNDGKRGLMHFLKYLIPHKKFIIQLALGIIFGSLTQLLMPFFAQSVMDVGIQTNNLNFIYLILFGQFLILISQQSVDFIRRWIILHLGTRLNISVISDFLSKLLKLPILFFESRRVGDILQRIDDHQRIETFFSSSSINVIVSIFTFLIFSAVLVVFNATIFTFFMIMSVLYVAYVLLFMKRRKLLDYRRFSALSNNQDVIVQLVQGIQEIKLNNCEQQKRWEWERVQAKLFKVNLNSIALEEIQQGGSFFLNEAKNIFITFLAAKAVMDGSISIGTMIAIQYIIGQLNGPISTFIGFIHDLQDAKISFERIGEIQSEKREIDSGQLVVPPKRKVIELRDVSFKYFEGGDIPYVLKNINLDIVEGGTTAIVGSSGSGKTTLLKLLLKFYEPTSGQVVLNGTNLQKYNTADWRDKCGVVMQDGYIFTDTVDRNIALGDEIIDQEKLENAIDIANIREVIDSLPVGTATTIGDNGVGLSQGQKQRVLIARSVYKNPDFIFFDEATSSLDANNEKQIIESLDNFFEGRTAVVIAHRLSTVRNADKIVVLDKGEIIETGTHFELVERRGKYFELIKNQLELA